MSILWITGIAILYILVGFFIEAIITGGELDDKGLAIIFFWPIVCLGMGVYYIFAKVYALGLLIHDRFVEREDN